MRLFNLGYKKYGEFAKLLRKYKKPVIVNVASFNFSEYAEMNKYFQQRKVDLVEINFFCPNIESNDRVAYNLELVEKILAKTSVDFKKLTGLQLPFYFEDYQFKKMAELMINQKSVTY